MLRDARQHARADFLTFVEGKDEVIPAFSGKYTMRAGLPLERPAASEKRPQNAVSLRRCPRFHAANSFCASSGSGSPLSMRSTIPRSASDRMRARFNLGVGIDEYARQRRGKAASVLFALDFGCDHSEALHRGRRNERCL